MIINKIERNFEFNIQAFDDISELCENNDIANIGKLIASYGNKKNIIVKLAIILNKAYEDRMHFENHAYIPVYLTEDDFRFLQVSVISELEQKIAELISGKNNRKVEVKEQKKKEEA